MWSQYDENISANPFFKEILENHNDIIEESTIQRWIICIPRIGTIEPVDISSDIILDHVVLPRNINNQRFHTLSKKQIIIQNKQIVTDDSNAINCIDILFEETFYMNKNSKFTIWCLERPLFLKKTWCDSHSSKNLSNLHDCIDFLWCESLSHNVLDSIKNLALNYIKNDKLDVENEQTERELIGILYSQCLQLCFKKEILKEKCMQSSQFLENMKLAVETYMQYCLGGTLIFRINTVNHQKDGHLNKVVKNYSDIQYQDLGIASDFSDTILNAKCELNQINSYCTVLDKIGCLKKTLDYIFEYGKMSKMSCVTSDDVLQILVFLILKLNVNNWFSNLIFMKEFQLSIEKSEQTMFCISSLEAALEFIGSTEFCEIKNKNFESAEMAVSFLDKKIKSGDIKDLSNLCLISKSDADEGMCHPLCTCRKCQNIVQQKSSISNMLLAFTEMNQSLLIIFASRLDKCAVVEFLLNMEIDINVTDCFGKTSLHYAASKGFQQIVLLLVNKKSNVNFTDNDKNTPLHLACLNGHENCVKALIYSSPEVNLNVGNAFGDTPLILAARWGYLEIVRILLENGALVAVKNKRNQTVFDVASNLYVVRCCEKYSNKSSNLMYEQVLEYSVIGGNRDDNCKSHGIRPRNTDQFKRIDLLLKSIENNDFPLTSFYLGYSNNTRPVKNGTCHPLCVCEKCGNEQADNVKKDDTLNNVTNINVNMCDANGYTPLHTSAKFGRTEILRLLLDIGALPNVKTFKTLLTPLHLSCIHERIQIVRELLKCGECNVDEQDANGNTPLYYACQNGNVKIAEILLSHGADCNIKNATDKSAFTLSEENMQYGIFKLLKDSIKNSSHARSSSNSFH